MMETVSYPELVETLAGMEWRELDALAETSWKKRDLVVVAAIRTELDSRKAERCDDPIGFALALRRVKTELSQLGL